MPRVLRCRAWQEGDMWVSRCLELGVASCGSTFKEAKNNLHEAIVAYLKECGSLIRRGEKVEMKAAPLYWWRARWFDLCQWWCIRRRRKPDVRQWKDKQPEPAYG